MSCYTGRYTSSHGSTWNGVPLRVGEYTLGDHLRAAGMDAYLVGKTHMRTDKKGMARLGIDENTITGRRVAECGFDPVVRDDGLWGLGPNGWYYDSPSSYNEYLWSKGYDGENPWHDYANASIDEEGNIATGWHYENCTRPANIREEDSETPWLTREAISFLEQQQKTDAGPFMAHISYIKPHWPFIVPAPYHNMYGPNTHLPVVRNDDERVDQNPIYAAFSENVIGRAFHKPEVRTNVMTAYMGLIKQIDDQMGVLFDYLRSSGQMENTMIILTSDHGDYLGDHWLGEKDLFHDPSAKVPLIIYDPSPEADKARGTVVDAPTEAIDVVATCIEFAGGEVPDEHVEGLSLMPFLNGQTPSDWREFAVSEYDYSMTPMATKLNMAPKDARLFMIADSKYKFIHAEGGIPPMLFDLEADPDELVDLGRDPEHADIRAHYYGKLLEWALRCGQRVSMSDKEIVEKRGQSRKKGIVLGVTDPAEIDDTLLVHYRGPARQRYI